MKNYWFALKSHVYVEFKENKILLYDTELGNEIETGMDEAITLIYQMYEPQNLGVTSIDSEVLTNPYIGEFIREVVEKQMGDLIEKDQTSLKSIRLIPILNLQKDIDKFKDNKEQLLFFEKDTYKYLMEINVYLNNICDKSCKHCESYCKQTHCCTVNENKEELDIEYLKKLLDQLRYSPINSINLLGGNILDYNYLFELEEICTTYPKNLHCYLHYMNYQKHPFIESQMLELIVTFPVDDNRLQEICSVINKENTRLHYIIENEEQYNHAEYLIEKFEIKNYCITPFFTGENLGFFKENIFMKREDIFHKTFQMREIFRNKKLNSNFFGMLYILPDGTAKANMNTPALGNIKQDDVLNIIYKELIDNTAWRDIRDSQPCDKCIYQFICPAPSDYERAIGQANLCHIEGGLVS